MNQEGVTEKKNESFEQTDSVKKQETITAKENHRDEEEDEGADQDEEKEEEQLKQRKDDYVVFTNEKDLRHHETISIKAQQYKGIALKIKIMNHIQMENVLFAIEQAKDRGITNLRFEDCRIFKKGVTRLIEFIKNSQIIESFGLIKVSFEDSQEFKKLVEAVTFNQKIEQFSVQSIDFDEEFYGKTMSRCILESRSLKELDMSYVNFYDPKSFYEMSSGLLHERCRLGALKLKGINFGQLEGKVMQFILMRNKSLQTLDLSQASTDLPENLEWVFQKFDQFCQVRTLLAETLNADFNYFIEAFGEALGVNTKLESLSIKENKIKQTQYCNFWELMANNRTLRRLNLSKTEVTDKVCQKLSTYLQFSDVKIQDMNLSRNSISTDGLIALAEAIRINKSIQKLNLSQNFIRDGGMAEFVVALIENKTLEELCLSTNKINNIGVSTLSGFLGFNTSIKVFDISRNNFSDTGFIEFAKHLAFNKGIESLNISRNKDVSDEIGLKELAQALSSNSSISIMDLTGLKIRKPCVVQYFQPALQQNITLKRIIGKLPPGIITDDLKDNITIENEIQTQFKCIKRENKRELSKIALHRVDQDQTQLDLIDQRNELLIPSLKFIRYRKIHVVDLSNMKLEDESMRMIGSYLQENPELRSLSIADNYFTDDGFAQVIQALRSNTHLNHLNILGCKNVTNLSLNGLEDMISQVNMSLYLLEIEQIGFDREILNDIITQASLNRAIQEHLKPRRVFVENQSGSSTSETPLCEIKFEEGSKIAQNFDSAIKVWRILEPSVITVMNEQLGDNHVIKLCNFLSNRNLIKSLNLRRNSIGDHGAIAISEYIQKHDKTLTCLELERNEINDDGGEALLKAMQTNMRIETCKMAYGNPLKQKICRQIEREIKANMQIKATVLPTYKANNNSLTHYEETDRGPEFVRCALKSCELFQILHLSLPDNMIGEKEMNDIAYVISRNTPLKILNLSDNVIDTNAAFILAEALKSNSHLRELDLSMNRLGDAGIALLMQPFILQKLQQTEKQNHSQGKKKKKKNQGQQSESQVEDDVSLSSEEKKKQKEEKQKRIKTKIKKIILHGNEQSNEALKHIFTALIANHDLQIMTDTPEIIEDYIIQTTVDSEEPDLQEDKDSEVLSNNSDSNNTRPNHQLTKAKEDHDDSILLTKTEQKIEDILEGEEPLEQKDNKNRFFKKILKSRFCKPCRQICFRDPSKPKLSVLMVLFPSCFRARAQAKQFKMSWNLLTQYETLSQPKVFISLIVSFLLFIVTIIIIPIANADFNGVDESELSQQGDTIIIGKYDNLLTVSIIFAAYWFINSLIEWVSVFTLSSSYYFDSKHEYQVNQTTPNIQSISPVPQPLSPHHTQSPDKRKTTKIDLSLTQSQVLINQKEQQTQKFQSYPPGVCNIYLILRWLIGSLTNITNYLHVLFISLAFTAYFQSTNMSQGKTQKVNAPGSLLEIVWLLEIIIAICAIVAGNIGRVKSIARYIFLQPHIYFLLPMTQRNIHLAWILNLQVLAISFESISLSEYMIALGGPVMPGKKKDNVLTVQMQEQNKVESLQDSLSSAKYKYQDMPMILVLLVHIIIGIAVNGRVQTGAKAVILDTNHTYACFAALGLTVLQVFIIRADLQWTRENKEVDINNIAEALKIRQAEIEKRKVESKGQSLNQIEHSHETGGEKSSNYTSRSIISNGIGDVMRELDQLNNEDIPQSPKTLFSPNVDQQEQIANEANQKIVNLSQNKD